uniref:Uncharacterized protein n=1 Tax=Salix viminalis TaxID=40686 RepID=A0A6N2LYS0_SALVM
MASSIIDSKDTILHLDAREGKDTVSYGSDKIIAYLAEEFPSLITRRNSQNDTVLHLAARRGKHSDIIKSLAQSNPSLMRKTNTKGNTPLHDAVINGNRELAKFLVSIDPEVAYYNNKNDRSPLYLAVEKGNKKGILDDLLKSGALIPIYREDGDALPKGKSPVHAAIEQRSRDILLKIEKAKPELLRITEKELGNSLHYASSIGFLEGVQFLLQKFRDGAYETNLEGNYPIHLACKSHSADVVKEYLDKFPYAEEFINKKGRNILHVAAKYGNCNVISYILKQDPKLVEPLLNEMDEDGNKPLHLAAGYGKSLAAFVLVRDQRVEHFTFPSLITTQNSQEDTVLHLAAREGKDSQAIKSLVDSNTSVVRMKNEMGNTPLHDAAIKGNRELAIFLVSKDPEVAYYNNKYGRSPLYLAVEKGNENGILDDLLISGASIPIYREGVDALPNGKSPVHAAIKRRDKDILEKIEKAKPEILRLTDEELGNSLHYASSIGFLEGVEFLLENFHVGAYERDSEGNYPIHLACKNDSVDVVKRYLDIFPYPKEFLNKKGQNILHVAAKYGNCSVISYILKLDPKLVQPLVNATDKVGNTPLHLAAFHGRPMASLLLVRDKRVEHFIDRPDNSKDVVDGMKNSTAENSTDSTSSERKVQAYIDYVRKNL